MYHWCLLWLGICLTRVEGAEQKIFWVDDLIDPTKALTRALFKSGRACQTLRASTVVFSWCLQVFSCVFCVFHRIELVKIDQLPHPSEASAGATGGFPCARVQLVTSRDQTREPNTWDGAPSLKDSLRA